MKGVILAGGTGSELRPLTDNLPKVMLTILGKPVLQYIIEYMKEAGIEHILVVIGYKGEHIREYFGNGSQFGVQLEYVTQTLEGIHGALLASSKFIDKDETFLLSFGDIMTGGNFIIRTLNARENLGTDMSALVTLVGDVGDFGVAQVSSEGTITSVLTYPSGSEGNYILAGSFVLLPEIFKYLKEGDDFPTALNKLISEQKTIAAAIWEKQWVDIGRPWNLLDATRMLLSLLTETRISSSARISSGATIIGPVYIGKNVTIESGAVIRGPVYIDDNTYIGNNTLIREYTAIGKNCMIGFGTEIKETVIMDATSIYRLCYIGASIIGRNVRINAGTMTIITTTPLKELTVTINGRTVKTGRTKLGVTIGDNVLINVNTTLYPAIRIKTGTVLDPAIVIKHDIL